MTPFACDPLFVPTDVDELGSPIVPFPSDELIDHRVAGDAQGVCSVDDPGVLNPIVEITNLTARTFAELWYVADIETSITNFDGYVEDVLSATSPPANLAFRIDNAFYDPTGAHHPLLSELLPGGGFEPGDVWQFVLQDYMNTLGLPPDHFTSFHVGTASIDPGTGVVFSSGSIIAIPVPEPNALLALVGVIGSILLGRRSAA